MFCQKSNSSCKGKALSLIVLVVLAVGGGAYYRFMHSAQLQQNALKDLRMTVLQAPRDMSYFQLEHYQQTAFNNQSLLNKWTMMFFGFADCPHLCPTTMAELNKVYTQLQEQKIQQLPQVVLVSIDPERDTSQRIADYAKGFNPNFIGVRGEKDKIDPLTKELGIAYFKTTEPGQTDPKNYSINHSGTIILFNPEGKIAGFFSTPHDAKNIAHDFIKVTKQG